MEIITTPIDGLLIIKPKVYEDSRGFFFEAYHRERYREAGIKLDFRQDNFSKSTYGVVRGLHYQLCPHSQAKLVAAVVGTVWDVAVDLRIGSPTFGQWYGVELSAENKLQFLIPQGFAHGFSVLSPVAVFSYKCDDYYSPGHERGILYNDPALNIDWMLPVNDILVSEKDKIHPLFADAEKIG
ncbi:MAG: dTDP-4-dehydrorhamnose 3,5-epimerase [Paludibacter sp.]|jgi:dTDP-4-dehydrorhamnose 3,5-epimerase|nr:dTDP-4-dehydrorhamnose 3,5-epimerase [Paludibacter sp.]